MAAVELCISATVCITLAMVSNRPASLVPMGNLAESGHGADEEVGHDAEGLGKGLDNIGGRASLHGVGGEAEILDFVVDQAGLVKVVVVDQIGLARFLGLLESLDLPVGVAPLVLANGDAEGQHFSLLLGMDRGQSFGVKFFVSREQRRLELVHSPRQFHGLLDLEGEAVWAGAVAAVLVRAALVPGAPALAQRRISEVLHVFRHAAVADAASALIGVDEGEPVVNG